MKLKDWLNKGEGGQWYESYITNGDLVYILFITLVISSIIIGVLFIETIY